jgi:hypothetical protein
MSDLAEVNEDARLFSVGAASLPTFCGDDVLSFVSLTSDMVLPPAERYTMVVEKSGYDGCSRSSDFYEGGRCLRLKGIRAHLISSVYADCLEIPS